MSTVGKYTYCECTPCTSILLTDCKYRRASENVQTADLGNGNLFPDSIVMIGPSR